VTVEFILLGHDGGVDGPIVTCTAGGRRHRQRPQSMLLRDVDNLHNFFGRLPRPAASNRYGEEIWAYRAACCLDP
jgi:hypothetical protein